MSKITVQVISWNLNCKNPNFKLNLKQLLTQQSPSPDIIAVGVQEIMTQFNVMTRVPSEQVLWYEDVKYGSVSGINDWIDIILESIEEIHGNGPNYKLFWAGRRAGFGMVLVLKEGVSVESFYSGSIGTGLGGLYGNKVIRRGSTQIPKRIADECERGPKAGNKSTAL
jgi:hypothetical protein